MPPRWLAGSDVAVVFAGDYETEGSDRACLSLECPNTNGDQDSMIEQVAAANPNTVVVLETGGPVLTPWRDKVKGLLEAWYPGEQGGPAIARVLFGDADPGGRLPATFPREEGDIPTAGDPEKYPGVAENVKYKEGVLVGYRWYDANRIAPAFPFGYGLSYTRFRYGAPEGSASSGDLHGEERGQAARHRGAAAVPRAAVAGSGCGAAAAAAQGLPEAVARPRASRGV